MIQNNNITLKRTLGTWHVWGLAVGLVISGEYFGWNYGWAEAGTVGFMVSTLIVTLMYACFMVSLTELAIRIPDAGGPTAYAKKAMGPLGESIAGYATFIEFVFAPPAIALAIGSYIHFLLPEVDIRHFAAFIYLIFTLVNLLGIRQSALFNLVITAFAVVELIMFCGITLPHFEMANFMQHQPAFSFPKVFAALPFAIWVYLGIEGISMVSEEVRIPAKSIPRGGLAGILTLVILAIGVMLGAGGVGDWRTIANIDHPLPAAIGSVLGSSHLWTRLFAGLGIFGLIASFHSLIIGYSRQIFALSRLGILPVTFTRLSKKNQTPYAALLLGSVIGLICVYTGTTSFVITLSALGAIVVYIICMLSLLKIKKQDPEKASYNTPFYPFTPILAIAIAMVCLIAAMWYNPTVSITFFGVLGFFLFLMQWKKRNTSAEKPPL
jgi:ethanolamine permease